MLDPELRSHPLGEVRTVGVSISMDDFGAGNTIADPVSARRGNASLTLNECVGLRHWDEGIACSRGWNVGLEGSPWSTLAGYIDLHRLSELGEISR